ncbi:hypothetical protein QR680_018665 [Steinernema hermaphroditum]|uniref:Intraflagellar transport protein 46 homolog n=1 Tax=Steinernema hermaphroditum TaxID=289476 RepID=A0AA39LRF9_9BILA|nr:hypothetical protein QR680_018665 [Steinernema hermaphroditum]
MEQSSSGAVKRSSSSASPPLIDDDSDGLGSDEKRRSHIVGLEEEQGRFPLPEVDVPPGYESDDDIPLKEGGNWPSTTSASEPFLRSETQLNSNLKTGNESDRDSRGIERGESLEEFEKVEEEVMRQIEEEQAMEEEEGKKEESDLSSDGDEDAAPSFQNRQSVTDIKFTNPRFEMSVEEEDDEESLSERLHEMGTVPEKPMGPPPAYTPDRQSSPMKRTGIMGAMGEMGGGLASAALGVAGFGFRQSNQPPPSSGQSRPHSDYGSEHHDRSGPLPVTQQQELLFRFVDEFVPHDEKKASKEAKDDFEPKLYPFIVDFFPAVGDTDPFIKIPRPDGIDDNLGIVVLDEPAVDQTDPVIMDMKLKMNLKNDAANEVAVKNVERADKHTEVIEQWIKNIKELHSQKPSTSVTFRQPMPDFDKLMQEWPPEIEQLLGELKLPTSDIDCSLEQYTDLCLNLVDIPVQKSRIESLHSLFSLYMVFKQSQHFRNIAANNNMMEGKATTDRLEL